MNVVAIAQVLFLLCLANGAPVVAKRLFGPYMALPLDLNLKWIDGRPLLGSSKTFRGILASFFACLMGGYLLGIDIKSSLTLSAAAMLGDIFSSFLKRRLLIEPSGRAMGLDYVPESLLPALMLKAQFEMSLIDVAIIVLGFWFGAAAMSPLLHRMGVRDKPY